MQQSYMGGMQQSYTNNIDIHNIEDNKDIYISDGINQSEISIMQKSKMEEWFDTFYSQYPKKVGKADAKKKFISKCKDEKTYKEIMDGLNKQNQTIFSKRETKYIPNPSTWLNQERWKIRLSAEKNRDGHSDGEERNCSNNETSEGYISAVIQGIQQG